MKRLFIGIKVTPEKELLSAFSHLQNDLGQENVRWTDVNNFHVTLFFLGNTEDKAIDALSIQLSEIANHTQPFQMNIRKIGTFGKRNEPRVIWWGIEADLILYTMQKKINESMKCLGFKPEKENYSPHLTIGRPKKINDLDLFYKILNKYQDIEPCKIEVEEIILFESVVSHHGTVYHPVLFFKFCK